METTDTNRTPGPRARTRLLVALVVACGPLLALGVPVGTVPQAGATTASDGTRTLTVSETTGLRPEGHALTVSGSGYDTAKGVYVALCVMPPAGTQPAPCGGGADREGTGGASAWISSDPPPYAVGLTQAYGPGGTFRATITVAAEIAPGVDCRVVACAVVTRADHMRSADRSQDVLVPVTFATPAAPVVPGAPAPAPGPVPSGAPTPPPTIPPTTTSTTTPAPTTTTTVEADGLAVTDGKRHLRVDRAGGLARDGDRATVTGTGFDVAQGVYVALCGPASEPGERPGPCASGEGRSAWVSSSPPDYGVELARPYGDGGSFEVVLDLDPVIDADTDCRLVACTIAVRNDDTAPDDRRQDLALPVAFDGPPAATEEDEHGTTPDTLARTEVAAAVEGPDGGSGGNPVVVVLAAVAVLVVAGGTRVVRGRAGTRA